MRGNGPDLAAALGWDCDLVCLLLDEEAAEDKLPD